MRAQTDTGREIHRRPIQIAVSWREEIEDGYGDPGIRLFALCNDGTIWFNDMTRDALDEWRWWILPTVPRGVSEDIMDPSDRDPNDL